MYFLKQYYINYQFATLFNNKIINIVKSRHISQAQKLDIKKNLLRH